MQKSQQTAAAPPAATGVPGTVSNTPNTQPPLFPSQGANQQSLTEENGTYGASKKTRRQQQGAGRIRRVTAAILINDRLSTVAARGKPATWKPRDPEEIKRLTLLAQAAIGFDAARGDQISVENISFEDNNGALVPGLPERLLKSVGQSESLLRYGTILAAMLGLIFFVIRPIAVRSRPVAVRAALGPGATGAGEQSGSRPVEPGEVLIEAQKKRAQSLHDGVIEKINGDPALSSRLLHSWIHAEQDAGR